MTARFAGIDVGERRLHCAVVDEGGRILECTTRPAGDLEALVAWCDGVSVVAIDAPQAASGLPHAGSTELPPKFRAARCGEIELGRRHGSWVSWVAPSGPPFPRWMEVGFEAFTRLGQLRGTELLEVYPHAAFRELAGGRRPPRKQSEAGRLERSELLRRAGLRGNASASAPHRSTLASSELAPAASAPTRSHHVLDALAAALVALDRFRGRAVRVSCGHDDSAIWLPGPLG